MKAKVVIGANFGDEGKGVITDYLCSRSESKWPIKLGVRFNGSAQAGHTVVRNPDLNSHVFGDGGSYKHVFHHYSSGSFNGALTYLSKFFLVHPMLFRREYEELRTKFIVDTLYVDGKCNIVTPYDVLINQAYEKSLGDSRFGSTGTGVSEAVIRSKTYEDSLIVADIAGSTFDFAQKLEYIRGEYMDKRLKNLGISLSVEGNYLRYSSELLTNFIKDSHFFLSNSEIIDQKEILNRYEDVVFEGAQGLLLDYVNGTWPHVTHSRTGITNVLQLCEESNIEELEAVYVTRPYITRHGAGPLDFEIPPIGKDETNVPHEYQGTLRYGILDVGHLGDRINKDLRQAINSKVKINPSIAITCINQIENNLQLNIENNLQLNMFGTSYKPAFISDVGLTIATATGFSKYYESNGPTYEDVIKNEFNRP